jgi:predicted nuclease of predicted toxin-antitoxin system
VKLLIDEQLSPRIVTWCAERKGVYAVAAAHVGLSGRSDLQIWQYAYENGFIVVTSNARDFMALLDVDLHPGLIILREGSLSRSEQWERLEAALDQILRHPDPEGNMVNRVVEIFTSGEIRTRQIPRSPDDRQQAYLKSLRRDTKGGGLEIASASR